jgi:hypothetical protein
LVLNGLCAVGDLHGDLDKSVEALKLARVISISPEGDVAWCGGDTTVVQLGDVMDRGNVEIGGYLLCWLVCCGHVGLTHLLEPYGSGILNLLRFLDTEARKQGGAVHMLNGNHESLNISGDFRCGASGVGAI